MHNFRGRVNARLVLTLIGLTLLSASTAGMDVILTRAKEKITGRVTAESDTEIVINIYHSSHPRAAFGNQTIATADIVRRIVVKTPWQELAEKRAAAAITGVDALLEVAEWAKKEKLSKEIVAEIVMQALARDDAEASTRAAAEKLLGARGMKELLRDRRLDPALATVQQDFLALPDHESRKEMHARLEKEFGIAEPLFYYERAWRSSRQARGIQENRPLSLRSAEIKAVYTLFVPTDYDPFASYPLLIGLHGGGAGGKAGDEVVGDGLEAMQKCRPEGEPRGYIIACPNALEAGWGGTNSAMIDALIAELELLYNIDQNRIYLTGHSMGGGGAWIQGPRLSEKLAAMAAHAAYSSRGFQQLADHRTAVYCYHGTDDSVCPVTSGRNAAKGLKKEMEEWPVEEFIYTEVPDSGHGYPSEVATEMFDFFADKVRHEGKGKKAVRTVGALSSFLAPPTDEESKTFGAFKEMSDEGDSRDRNELLEALLRGGGGGAEAATKLGVAAKDDAKLHKKLIEISINPRKNPAFNADVRKLAARALGLTGLVESLVALHPALADEAHEVRCEAAIAIGKIADTSSRLPLIEAFDRQAKILQGKVTGDRLDYADLERSLEAFAAILEGARGVKGEGLAAAIETSVVEVALFGQAQVDYTERAGENPTRLRREFASSAVLPTYETLDDPAGAAGLVRVRELFAKGGPEKDQIDVLLEKWR